MGRYRRNPRITETAVDDELFLVDPDSQEILHLDPIAGGLWRLLRAPATLAEIEAVFREAFPDAPGAPLARDLAAALDTLLAAGFIERA